MKVKIIVPQEWQDDIAEIEATDEEIKFLDRLKDLLGGGIKVLHGQDLDAHLAEEEAREERRRNHVPTPLERAMAERFMGKLLDSAMKPSPFANSPKKWTGKKL